MSSEWSWDWDLDVPEENGPAPFKPVFAGADQDDSPSAQRRSALAVALAVVQAENSEDWREDGSMESESAGGWTLPKWNPPVDPGPIWGPSVWPPPAGSLPVGDAISISIGGSGKRRLKPHSGGRRNSGKRDQRRSEH
jgi:hypothetical protein